MTGGELRAAIIGLSWIGVDPAGEATDPVLGTDVAYSHASSLAAHPDVATIVGCDPSASAREAFARNWVTAAGSPPTYASLEELLAEGVPDVASIATPDHLHDEVALRLIAAGVPMLYCEKPLAIDVAAADAVVAGARRHGTTIAVNYTRRWLPEFVDARARLRAGTIGDLSQVIVQVGGPRAMLFRNLTHAVDLLAYFAGAEPEWVFAELEPGFEDYGTAYLGDGQDPSLEPGANAYVAFANGVRGHLVGMKSMVAGTGVELVGAAGRITVDSDGARVQFATPEGPATRRLQPRFTVAGMAAAVGDLIASHRAGRPTASPPIDARRTVAITSAILESQARGNARVAVPSIPEER